jgi:hypothetical protein
MKFRYELILVTFIALILAMPSYSPAETILRAKGYSKVPWDPASGEVLSPVFWLKLDVDAPNKKFVVPDFVPSKANMMRLEFTYKNDEQRYQDMQHVGCSIGDGKRARVIPLMISLYSIDNGNTTIIEKKYEETTICDGWSASSNDVTIDSLPNLIIGKHYSIEVETTESHPEFKANNIEIYFKISYFGHAY